MLHFLVIMDNIGKCSCTGCFVHIFIGIGYLCREEFPGHIENREL